mmetsp:Transcript_1019/g.1297  ORF Transcript_1019/g.1297 Transcript_1019/m.1297 type:complete len:327 (+) Transcript_1019:124-1104(+)
MFGGLGGFGGGGYQPQSFEENYHCYSMACSGMDKEHLEKGDKILLPPSALDTLARLHIEYPMLFQIQSMDGNRKTHCGVLEFSAPEGSCYMPFWMMQNLLLEEGGMILVKNVSLPKATFCKLKPQSVDFLEISNPRAVLEHTLRGYSCVTKGDVVCIPYNDRNYYLEIKEVKPADAACIIETDCNVDFEEPVGYQEHLEKLRESEAGMDSSGPGSVSGSSKGGASPLIMPKMRARRTEEPEDQKPTFQAFGGSGARLDGKPLKASPTKDEDLETKSVSSVSSSGYSPTTIPGSSRPGSAFKRPNTAKRFGKKKNIGAFVGSGHKLS